MTFQAVKVINITQVGQHSEAIKGVS